MLGAGNMTTWPNFCCSPAEMGIERSTAGGENNTKKRGKDEGKKQGWRREGGSGGSIFISAGEWAQRVPLPITSTHTKPDA